MVHALVTDAKNLELGQEPQQLQQTPTEAFEFDYDDRNPFMLCNADFVPIYRGTVVLARCTLCKAPYGPQHKGTKCVTCGLGEAGGSAAGIDEAAVFARYGNQA